MNSFEELRQKRIRWVESSRENEFEEGLLSLLSDLYPDTAHFVYELLQNAEDAHATQVRFILSANQLEFEHDGSRLFRFEDVKGITSIGGGTKRSDPTAIGKFGVGFKSVFAYTRAPEIESGEFHFHIRDLVVPETDGLAVALGGSTNTRFVFPFNLPGKPSRKACQEVEALLRELGEETLLFLRHIQRIEYLLPDSALGYVERQEVAQGESSLWLDSPDIQGRHFGIIAQHPEDRTPATTNFLRFEQQVTVTDAEDQGCSQKNCQIAIAYGLVPTDPIAQGEAQGKELAETPSRWRIRELNPGRVCIYFPAKKETSNLRFHLHAPFASTVARDSIRACDGNNQLLAHLAKLTACSMVHLRDHALLTVPFLAVLPNDKDIVPPLYAPILTALREAFMTQDLVPMRQGGHAAANGVFRGSALLSDLISDADLVTLLNDEYCEPMWVANPQQRNQREHNFLAMLGVQEWQSSDLVAALGKQPDRCDQWLSTKTDEWHQGLYALLNRAFQEIPEQPKTEAEKRRATFKALRIVRTTDGSYRTGKDCYFPDNDAGNDDLMPRVRREVYESGKSEDQKKRAREFLEAIGVRSIGEREQVEVLLQERYSQQAVDNKTFAPSLDDLDRFVSLVEHDPSSSTLFSKCYVLKRCDGKWGQPNQVYLDLPFIDTGLSAYYERLGTAAALSSDYASREMQMARFAKFLLHFDIHIWLPITCVSCHQNPEWSLLSGYPGRFGKEEHIDYSVDALEQLLKTPSVALSRALWRACDRFPEALKASYKKSDKAGFRHGASQFAHILRNTAWIPQKGNSFVKPCEASVDELPTGFCSAIDKIWLEDLHFGQSARTRTEEYRKREEEARRMGFDSLESAETMAQLARLFRERGTSPEDYLKRLVAAPAPPTFPTRRILDPDRREDAVAAKHADAPAKAFEKRMRSVRTTRPYVDPSTALREQYTNDDGALVCQICKETMPFRKRNGEYYAEAVESLSKKHFLKDDEAQFLLLCPVCAAKYTEFIKHDDSVMERLKAQLADNDAPEVSLRLGEEDASLRFVETHRLDIRTILKLNTASQ